MKFDIVAAGYPSIDHILPVSRAPKPGETGIILEPPRLETLNLGGCAPNIAVAGARMGLKTAVIILVGEDPDGQAMISVLNQEGVNTQFGVQVIPNGNTAHSFLFVDPESRHQTFYYPGVSDCEEVTLKLEKHAQANWGVITVGNALHNRSALNWMVEKKVSILWSHRNDSRAFPDDLIVHLAGVSKIVVLNNHEAQAIKETLEIDSIAELLKYGPQAIILTKGAQGSQIITANDTIKIPAVAPKRMLDPTGAGDAFTAGVLLGLQHEFPLNICCQLGAVVSSFVIEAWGCQTNLPKLAEIKTRYHQSFGELDL